MSTLKTLRIGFIAEPFPESDTELHLRNRMIVYEQSSFLLLEFLRSSYKVLFSDFGGVLLENGSWTGLIGMLNRSEIDLAMTNFYVTDDRYEAVRFAYPFRMEDLTFITKNPEFTPHMFAIFSTMSAPVWIALGMSVITVVFISLMFNKKDSFSTIVLNTVSVLLHQTMIRSVSTVSQKCLRNVWLVGMTFFTLAFNSVLLSFLSFPPLGGVTNVKELANAVQMGEYNCMFYTGSSIPTYLSKSKERSLAIIGDNIWTNPHGFGVADEYFRLNDKKLAFFESREVIEFVRGRYFISEDRVFQFLHGMASTKSFCCKKQLDSAILKLQAGGFPQKFVFDRNFKLAFKTFSSNYGKDEAKLRKLTLTDVSAAFLFLISGYCISLSVLILELMLNRPEKPFTFC